MPLERRSQCGPLPRGLNRTQHGAILNPAIMTAVPTFALRLVAVNDARKMRRRAVPQHLCTSRLTEEDRSGESLWDLGMELVSLLCGDCQPAQKVVSTGNYRDREAVLQCITEATTTGCPSGPLPEQARH